MRLCFLIIFSSILFPALSQNKPVITGQKELRSPWNQSLRITLDDLTVSRSDGESYPDYPAGFSLDVFNGQNYKVSGTTITPAQDFTGTLTVPVRVNDGNRNSDKFNLTVVIYEGDGGDGGDDDDGDDDDDGGNDPQNVPPVIIGQASLSVPQGSSITIRFSDLFVYDPDDDYPNGFEISVREGSNYTISGNTVTPASGFSGMLTVPVVVNDGKQDSPSFNLSITVVQQAVNVAPVITGQNSLSTQKNQPVSINLTHLLVTDPDNNYPADFTLTILQGTNYTVAGTQVTPAAEFVGTLTVNVMVNDGELSSNSFPFLLVVIETGELRIIGQEPLQTSEDSSLEIGLADLVVNDPDNRYPDGFTIIIPDAAGYAVDGNVITPAPDFFGNLEVGVQISNGTKVSELFRLIVAVLPVNDPPVVEGVGEEPVQYVTDRGNVFIMPQVNVVDVDDEMLSFAEIRFRPGSYQPGGDQLIPNVNNASLRSVFDPANGVLFIIGEAPINEFVQMLRSVSYQFNASDTLEPEGPKIIEIVVSDGELRSEVKQVEVEFSGTGDLDIPSVFTPNDDNANDTWRIGGFNGDLSGQVTIRVYNKTGYLVYEAFNIQRAWDGKLNGKHLPADTYFYIIELNLPFSSRQYKGVVTLLR